MSWFGSGKSAAVKAAEEQRKIDKLKLKTEKEKAKIEKDKAKTEVRRKNGGIGVGGNLAFHDITPPQTAKTPKGFKNGTKGGKRK